MPAAARVGDLLITNGQFRLITNNSGHYKPTRENLTECVKTLLADGADLSQMSVVCKTYVGPTCRTDTWNTVQGFLTRGNLPDQSETNCKGPARAGSAGTGLLSESGRRTPP